LETGEFLLVQVLSYSPKSLACLPLRWSVAMDLTAICRVLEATQQSDHQAREAAEKHLTEATEGSPNELVRALAAVLAESANVTVPLRQEAAVILRQLVVGIRTRNSVWARLDDPTKKVLMAQVLATAESDPSSQVKRNAGQVVSETASKVASEFNELSTAWPEFLPAISRFVGSSSESTTRVVALQVLKDMVPDLGDGFMEQGESVIAMLDGVLKDGSPEVRSAAIELVFQLVEDLAIEDVEPLGRVMPAVISALQGFAKEGKEEQLKEVLEALCSSADEESVFFMENGLDTLWPTLVEIASAGAATFADEEIRHSAMEAMVTLALNLSEFFIKDGTQLERLLALNIEWLLEVEEDANVWTEEGKDDNDDDCDDDVVGIAEENLDRIGEKICEMYEEELMGMIFKLIRAAWQAPDSNWKHARASLIAIQQVAEHIAESAWVDQCIDFVGQNVAHAHPRVRYAAFGAMTEIAFHHSPHVQDTHHAALLPAIVAGIKDVNIRVATNAVDAFSALGEEGLDIEELESFADDLLMSMFSCLQQGQTRAMQESCLTGIATVAEIFEELFEPYYGHVMPALKHIVANALDEKDRILRGKSFECISVVGSVVSKELFTPDAHEVMQQMVQLMQAGFAADDQLRESVREASGRIADKLGKDFKPYVPNLLPMLFEVLKNRPKQMDGDDMPDEDEDEDEAEDMTLATVNGKFVGLKTMLLEEMKECLDLTNTVVESLEEDFCEFLPTTCQNLLPLLDLEVCADLGERVFKSWELLAEFARAGAEKGLIDRSVLQELVAKFLETVVGAMASTSMPGNNKSDDDDCDSMSLPTLALRMLQVRAVGVSGVIRKAGSGILTADVVQKMSGILMQLLGTVQVSQNEAADPKSLRRRGVATTEESDDSDDDEEGPKVTKQNVRFALADVAGALMTTNPDEFTQVALPIYMQLVQQLLRPDASESDRSLAFYITDDAVESLGERSVPFWSNFMNQALQGMVDKSAMVRQYASSTIGGATRQPIFAQMAPAAASQIHRILQKQGERHRRRRAVKADALQSALAVDAGIRALGDIAEHHEQRLGEHAATVWSMWLSNLPLKYDQDGGQRAHRQLLGLVVRSHPLVTAPQNLPQVVSILAEVYKTKFSNDSLNEDIAKAMACMGEAPLKEVCSSIQEKHQKKVERILANAKAGAC